MRALQGSFVLAPLLALLAIACSDGSIQSGRRITTETGELSIMLPDSWGNVRNENDAFELYSGSRFINDHDCGGRRDRKSIYLRVARQEGGTGFSDYPARPRRFTSKSGTGLRENIAGLGDCGYLNQWIQFTEHGSRYAASLTLGRDVTRAERAAAYEVLDTLRVDPSDTSAFLASVANAGPAFSVSKIDYDAIKDKELVAAGDAVCARLMKVEGTANGQDLERAREEIVSRYDLGRAVPKPDAEQDPGVPLRNAGLRLASAISMAALDHLCPNQPFDSAD
jgi:hypothetical protein